MFLRGWLFSLCILLSGAGFGQKQKPNYPDLIPYATYTGEIYGQYYKFKWGYCDSNKNIRIKPQFQSASLFKDGLAVVSTWDTIPGNWLDVKEDWKVINTKGEVVIDVINRPEIYEGKIYDYDYEANLTAIYDVNGTKLGETAGQVVNKSVNSNSSKYETKNIVVRANNTHFKIPLTSRYDYFNGDTLVNVEIEVQSIGIAYDENLNEVNAYLVDKSGRKISKNYDYIKKEIRGLFVFAYNKDESSTIYDTLGNILHENVNIEAYYNNGLFFKKDGKLYVCDDKGKVVLKLEGNFDLDNYGDGYNIFEYQNMISVTDIRKYSPNNNAKSYNIKHYFNNNWEYVYKIDNGVYNSQDIGVDTYMELIQGYKNLFVLGSNKLFENLGYDEQVYDERHNVFKQQYFTQYGLGNFLVDSKGTVFVDDKTLELINKLLNWEILIK